MDARNASRRTENDYIFATIIGEGSFSTVYLAKEIDNGKEYAIKVCDKRLILREKKQEYIKREKEALHKLSHTQGTITLVSTFQSDTKLFFCSNYAKHGEILNYLQYMSLACARFYAAELLVAIEGIHKQKIIHRDLKPQNLLLDQNMHLLVADFGSSKIFSDEMESEKMERIESKDGKNRRTSFVGTAHYCPPEILKGRFSTYSSDLFSYGCIIYEFLCGKPAFNGDNEYIIFQKIQNIDYSFPEGFDPCARDLIEKLLIFEPADRLGSQDQEECYTSIRNHSFFANVNFEKLFYQTSPLQILADIQNDTFSISDDWEPGLGDRQLRRILQLEMNLTSRPSTTNAEALRKFLEEQKNNPWNEYVEENEFIIKYGFLNKKKGLFWRRRMFLLTNTPRFIYIDPVNNIKKGEIPFDLSIRPDPTNFKIFNVITPNRIYYLEDPEGSSDRWCRAIEDAKKYCR